MQTSPRWRQRSLAVEEDLRRTFAFQNETAPYIVYDVPYWLFGQLPEHIPPDYCGADPAAMIAFQTGKIERHMERYDDAYVPFLMPWYGTGVLASGFGVPVKFQEGMDPAVELPTISRVEQIAELRAPDFDRDGLLPRVLDTIRTMRRATDLPVGVTDCQGPLTTALQIVGYDKMIYWMVDHPERIHALMQLVTDALIAWVKRQKEVAGQDPCDDAYVLGVKIPGGLGGVWISDDDSVLFSPALYREFVVPYNSRVLAAFGGGAIHYCGNSNQHVESFLATEGLRAVHNVHLDDLDAAARLRHALAEKGIVTIAADFNVDDDAIDGYFEELFHRLGTRGLIVVAYVAPAIALRKKKYTAARRDPERVGLAIEAAIRKHNRAS